MKIAPAVAAQDFQLAVDGLDHVGGGQGAPEALQVVEESQVVTALFADFAEEGRVAGLEALAEVLELGGHHFGVPGRLEGAAHDRTELSQDYGLPRSLDAEGSLG